MEEFQPKTPLNITSILELLEKNANSYTQKEAVISVDPHTGKFDSISHLDLKNLVFQTASLLNSLGIKKGDKYAILMPNTAEVLLFELAGALIGATTVPLDMKRDTLPRKIFKIKETDAKVLFTSSEEELPRIKTVAWKDFTGFKKLLPQVPKNIELNKGLETDYIILYTSGTTNMPKGVPLSIRACLLNAMGIATWQKMTDRERFNVVLPLHHINSTIFCLSVLLMGGTVVLNKIYSASKFWNVVSNFRCTNTSIVPTILHDLLARKDEPKPDTSSLKKMCIGSAPVLPEQTLAFYRAFKTRITQGYGQTETALRVSGVPVELSEKSYLQMIKTNSIGTQLANNKLAILDSENNPKEEGEEGEICIAGPTIAEGYLNDPQSSAHSFKNGWFHSGDLGYYKKQTVTLAAGENLEDKFHFIIGRIKEIIIKGGVNVSPSAIEDGLLKDFPAIKEVSVVGYPDARMGEEIAAVIVIKDGYEKSELEKDILKGPTAQLTKYEIPKKVFFVSELPKTSTGKIQRVETKSWVSKWLSQKGALDVRIIRPEETEILKKATEINNQGFKDVHSKWEDFQKRAQSGTLFGVFNDKGDVLGTLSCVQMKMSDLEKIKTWDEVTASGTLQNNDPKGDSLVCVAISVKRTPREEPAEEKADEEKLQELAKKQIEDYVKSGKDHVLNFHAKSKGGVLGATFWKILENGRKEDKESMGYNVLLKYPQINQDTEITNESDASPSFRLMEEAFLTAQRKGIKKIIAFSRPGGFRKYLLDSKFNNG